METENKYFIFDTETGGLSTDCSLLTLHGIVCNSQFRTCGEIDLKIKPDDGIYKIQSKALSINHIDITLHEQEAFEQIEAKKELETFLTKHIIGCSSKNEKLIAVGQNIHFDIAFIQKHLLPRTCWNIYFQKRSIDTASLAMFLQMLGHIPNNVHCSLLGLCDFYDIPLIKPHDAKEDCLATLKVFKKMYETMEGFKPKKG